MWVSFNSHIVSVGYVTTSPLYRWRTRGSEKLFFCPRTLQFINLGRGTEFLLLAPKILPKFRVAILPPKIIPKIRVVLSKQSRSRWRQRQAWGERRVIVKWQINPLDSWQKASPGSTASQTPGCCVHVKAGVPLLIPHKGAAWASRGSPAPNSVPKGR